MPTSPHAAQTSTRRTMLRAMALAGSSAFLPWHGVWAQEGAPAPGDGTKDTRDAWRAMGRLGYGPNPALVQTLHAAPGARAWALQQIDLAYAASQTPPRIVPEWAGFNASLPELFKGLQNERIARAQKEAPVSENRSADSKMERVPAQELAPEFFSRTMVRQAAAWRLTSCSQPETENPLLARMTEFWFNHLNIYNGKGTVRPFTGHYVIHVARAHALGKFEDLLLASARHPAMLNYLDQAQSVAEGTRGPQGQPRGLNENYARELMELHTLGVHGGYTQSDVRELARLLTGWTQSPVDTSGYRFVLRNHSTGAKRVMGTTYPTSLWRSGEREGEDAIRMLARHPSTAQRISLRLAQFFVADAPPPGLVQKLGDTFLASQGDMRFVLRALLESDEFWLGEHRLFKTPMDFVCSALTATQGLPPKDAPSPPLDRPTLTQALAFLEGAGQPLHGWQTPDGYRFDAATWLVPEALTRRADYALAVARNSPELDYLYPYVRQSTRDALAQQRPALRAGLLLASPDFMYK